MSASKITVEAEVWRNGTDGEPQITLILPDGSKAWLRVPRSSAKAYAACMAALDAVESAGPKGVDFIETGPDRWASRDNAYTIIKRTGVFGLHNGWGQPVYEAETLEGAEAYAQRIEDRANDAEWVKVRPDGEREAL